MKNHGCCDLKYAIKLKKLGVKQESLWWWVGYNIKDGTPTEGRIYNYKKMESSRQGIYSYSAFTVAELGEMLPQNMSEYPLVITKLKNSWLVEYLEISCDGGHYWHKDWMAEIEADTEANAKAKMLIYLKGKGIINV